MLLFGCGVLAELQYITSFEVITCVLMSVQDTLKEWIHLLPISQIQDNPSIFVHLLCDPFKVCSFQSISFIFWNYPFQIAAPVSGDTARKFE